MTFATELDVRNECRCFDPERLSSEAIGEALSDAHQRILGQTMLSDSSLPHDAVTRAEVFLALSMLLRREEIQSRMNARVLRMQSLKFDDPEQADRLERLHERLEEEAWGLLRPWWLRQAPGAVQLAGGGEA